MIFNILSVNTILYLTDKTIGANKLSNQWIKYPMVFVQPGLSVVNLE